MATNDPLGARLDEASAALVEILKDRGVTIAVCESLTAGMLGAAIAGVPGASQVFAGGFITYATALKHELAGVDSHLLTAPGPVSADCAKHMALGTAARLGVDYAIALTGVAGPDPVGIHPVGEVWAGFADGAHRCLARLATVDGYCRFAQLPGHEQPVRILTGDRFQIRQASALFAIETAAALIHDDHRV